jgi:uncharacterized protein YutE (UPF0331/DUF86 family)
VGADDILRERLRFLRGEADYLKSERGSVRSFQQYVKDIRLKKAIERSLQVAIEACLDIGRRLIALEGFRYPEDNKDVFQVLQEEGVISQELLPSLVDMARFRNLVVHDYAKIDDAKVYAILTKRLGDFDEYGRSVVTYLECRGWEKVGQGSPGLITNCT